MCRERHNPHRCGSCLECGWRVFYPSVLPQLPGIWLRVLASCQLALAHNLARGNFIASLALGLDNQLIMLTRMSPTSGCTTAAINSCNQRYCLTQGSNQLQRQPPKQGQEAKRTDSSTATASNSSLVPAAGRQFDFVMESVFRQLFQKDWQLSAPPALDGVLATTSLHQAFELVCPCP